MDELKVKQKVYYARILPNTGTYEVCDLTIRMVSDTWFSAIEDRTKHAFLFNNVEIGKRIFLNRLEALELVTEAESHKKHVSDEILYEEY